MTILNILDSYMKDNKISYRELARRSGRSAQNVWNTFNGKKGNKPQGEKGTQQAQFATIKRFCDALGFSIVIRKREDEQPDRVLDIEEFNRIPFDGVVKTLDALGYDVAVENTEEKNSIKLN